MLMRGHRAFTLIETLAVIALLAILTAAAAVSLSGTRRAARAEDAADRLMAFDRATRDAARRVGRSSALRFELNRGRISRTDGDATPTPLALDGARVTRVIVRGESFGYGEVVVPFSDRGQSPSYAVLLAGQGGQGGQRWVAFAGLTGQTFVLNDERDVQDILSPSGAAAPAADASLRADAR
jgi:prepilin-type N-terminal cleavage/methylation domain-containing protein